ncbi:hypothetical protein FZC33_03650 [Labrys sp. KNU-23]|uniref:hypothetical protein n=1 Tax=Labrys sp. KNU-23 TaxID=2789216 RepID=UPI0011EFC735|nr:hypothetical protein [Labrys sp. KNU-23]QEN85353.1 hypothetical protein FZC33_03650 [Labrys sp. KNU-23]
MHSSSLVAILSLSLAAATSASAQLLGEKYTRYPGQPVCTLFVSVDKIKAGRPLPTDCIKLRQFQKVTYQRNVGGYEVIDVGGRIYFTFGNCDYPGNTSPSKNCFTFKSNAVEMKADDIKLAERKAADGKRRLDKCLELAVPARPGERRAAQRNCTPLAATYRSAKKNLDRIRAQ